MKSAQSGSNNRSNRDRKNLLSFWNWAQKILDIPNNPASKMDTLPHHRKEQYVPMPGEIKKLLMASTQIERVFLNCYLQTGARRSEVFRWKWGEDVDFSTRQVRLGTMKTRDGSIEYVWLPMSDELFADLQWWYKHRPDREAEHVWVVPEGSYAGQPYTYPRKFLCGLCKRAEIREFSFHSLRRYAASLMASRGVPMKLIQGVLRHGALSTTEEYVKHLSEDLRSTVEFLSSEAPAKKDSHPDSHPNKKRPA